MNDEYFRLFQNPIASNPITLYLPDQKRYPRRVDQAAFCQLEELIVGYYQPAIGLEICDLLESPCFLIADRFKDLFQLLAPQLQWKGIQLYPNDFNLQQGLQSAAPLYWIPYLDPVDCLHSSTQFHDIGLLKELVVDEAAIRDKHILKVGGILEDIWLVSLTAAESILRRRPLAIGLEQVKVR